MNEPSPTDGLSPGSPLAFVLDTNVLVAGLRSRLGAAHAVLGLLDQGATRPVLTTAVVLEYEAVLKRPGRVPLTAPQVDAFLDILCAAGDRRDVYFRWFGILPDPADEHLPHTALAAGGCPIVTHNVRDFSPAAAFGVSVFTPGAWLRLFPPPDP